MTRIATEIKKLDGFTGDARLFELSEPVEFDYDYTSQKNKQSTKYVVVSAADAMFSGPKTYIFPADETGEIVSWSELDGSFKGGLDHEQALSNAGFEVQR